MNVTLQRPGFAGFGPPVRQAVRGGQVMKHYHQFVCRIFNCTAPDLLRREHFRAAIEHRRLFRGRIQLCRRRLHRDGNQRARKCSSCHASHRRHLAS